MARTAMVVISVRIPPEMADAVEQLAQEARISLTAWVRRALEEKLKREWEVQS